MQTAPLLSLCNLQALTRWRIFISPTTALAEHCSLIRRAVPGAVNNAPVSISNGEVLAIRNPHSGDVTFTGRTGTLWLDEPSSFTGTVSDFGAKTAIDLPTMAFNSETTVGYSPKRNGTGGTLSVSDGVQSAQIALLGQYTAASFGLANDHHGGTMVVFEPPQSANQSLLSTPRHG